MTDCDFHIHTNFCDGEDSAEDVVKAAIAKNMKRIGFSGHSYTSFDGTYCMTEKGTEEYRADIARLKEKYKGEIEIFCGIEQDFYADYPAEGFEYIIGSVHYLKKGEEYFEIDGSAEVLRTAAEKYYGGDVYKMAEEYFETVAEVVSKTGADIIGHFDLITKFNEVDPMFDEKNARYIAAYKKAVDALIPFDVPFEINTGAMSRGYRTAPYPSADILEYIRKKGGKTILSSDSHRKETLCYLFDDFINGGLYDA